MKRSIRWIAMGCVLILCCVVASFLTTQYWKNTYRMRYQVSKMPYQEYLEVESVDIEEGIDMIPRDEDTVNVHITVKGKFHVSDASDPVYIDGVHISERLIEHEIYNQAVLIEITPIVKCKTEITGERKVEIPVEYSFDYPLRTYRYGQNSYDFRCNGKHATYGIWQMLRGDHLTDEDWRKLQEY